MIPDVLTRVSEYVPEVIDYVKTIVNNGFGLVLQLQRVYMYNKLSYIANHLRWRSFVVTELNCN